MKGGYFAIIAAGVLIAIVRIRRRRAGGGRPALALPAVFGRVDLHERFGDTGLIAAREVRERLRGRLFRVVTIVILAIVAAAILIPTIHSGSSSSSTETVALVAAGPSSTRSLVLAEARSVKLDVKVVTEPDSSAARSALFSRRVDLVVDGDQALVVSQPLKAGDTSKGAELVRSLSVALGQEKAWRAAGLTAAQAATVAHATPLPVKSLQPGKTSSPNRAISVIGEILIFVMLTQYNTWTLMGVMEEKSSRVVEVLLSAVRPIQLLSGKVLGIGLVALMQAALIVAFALVLGDAVGPDVLKGTAPLVVVTTLVWLVLGYTFYCWVYAAAGSFAERQDQIQSLAIPLSAPIIAAYVISLTVASSGNAAIWFKVLAFFPPTAPLAMPVFVGIGQTTWWEVVISAILTVLATVGVARVASGIYRRAVLRSGRRVKLTELLAR